MKADRRPGAGALGLAPAVGDAGMVTAELAVGLPALVLVGLLATTGVQVVAAQLRCLDAAAIAARLAARGEPAPAVEAAARAAAPSAAQVTVSHARDLVVATVSSEVHPLGLARLLPAFVVRERAAQADEPGSDHSVAAP